MTQSRREFLKQSALASAALGLVPSLAKAAGARHADTKGASLDLLILGRVARRRAYEPRVEQATQDAIDPIGGDPTREKIPAADALTRELETFRRPHELQQNASGGILILGEELVPELLRAARQSEATSPQTPIGVPGHSVAIPILPGHGCLPDMSCMSTRSQANPEQPAQSE